MWPMLSHEINLSLEKVAFLYFPPMPKQFHHIYNNPSIASCLLHLQLPACVTLLVLPLYNFPVTCTSKLTDKHDYLVYIHVHIQVSKIQCNLKLRLNWNNNYEQMLLFFNKLFFYMVMHEINTSFTRLVRRCTNIRCHLRTSL